MKIFKLFTAIAILLVCIVTSAEEYQLKFINSHHYSKDLNAKTLVKVINNNIKRRQFHKDQDLPLFYLRGKYINASSSDVILAIISIESKFNPVALNPTSGCSGLLQLEKDTYRHMYLKDYIKKDRWKDIFNPYYNTFIGMLWFDITYKEIVRQLPYLQKHEQIVVAIAAYNKGIGAAVKEIKTNGGLLPEKYKYVEMFKDALWKILEFKGEV